MHPAPELFGVPAETVAAAAESLTALVAIAAAVFAWRQVREARRTREDQAQPFVVVDIVPDPRSDNALNLVIENIGFTMATDVKLAFDPPLTRAKETTIEGSRLQDWSVLKEGIPALPPRKRIEGYFDVTRERVKTGATPKYSVSVSYRGPRKQRTYDSSYIIDLNAYYGALSLVRKDTHNIAETLEKIERRMEAWTESRSLRILGFDGKTWRDEELAELERRTGRSLREPRKNAGDT